MSPYILCLLIGVAIGGASTWRVEEWRADHNRLVALNEATRMNMKRESVNADVDKTVVAKLAHERVVTKTLIKEVIKYVPTDSPPVPGGFRVLHDAAALGEVPDPARGVDALAVPLADVAGTVVDNYAACRENATRLESLQQWVRLQGAVK